MPRMMVKEIGGIKIAGTSLAGEETVVIAPELNVAFDVGRAPREIIPIDTVCLSHGHMDHAAGVAYYFSQRTFVGNAPGRVIVHRSLAQPIQKLMDIWSDIEGHPSPGQVLGVEALEDVPIRRGLIVRPFTANHGAFALGFTLLEQRHKLKDEFAGKTGPQLVAMKKEGVEIERRIEVPLLTYTGDTALGRWMQHDFVRNSGVLLVECTFFERDHVTRARAGKHIHIVDLPEVYESVPDAQIVLTHITRRTDMREVRRVLQRTLKPGDLERTTILMERPPREERGHHRRPDVTQEAVIPSGARRT